MNYEIIFKQEFENIINNYDLKYSAIDENEFAIIGKSFALIFMIHMDDIYIRYVMRNAQGELEVYNFDSFIVEKFNSIDREGIKISNTIEEKIMNEIKIIAKGLVNHWSGLLKGDKSWKMEYLNYHLAGKPKMANRKISDILIDVKN